MDATVVVSAMLIVTHFSFTEERKNGSPAGRLLKGIVCVIATVSLHRLNHSKHSTVADPKEEEPVPNGELLKITFIAIINLRITNLNVIFYF